MCYAVLCSTPPQAVTDQSKVGAVKASFTLRCPQIKFVSQYNDRSVMTSGWGRTSAGVVRSGVRYLRVDVEVHRLVVEFK